MFNAQLYITNEHYAMLPPTIHKTLHKGSRQKGENMSLADIAELYKENSLFREYINKYSRAHRMLPEDTFKLKVVQSYAEYVKGAKK